MPQQNLVSLPFLSHRCGKRKPPYFPQTFEVDSSETTRSSSSPRFVVVVILVNFQTLNCYVRRVCAPVFPAAPALGGTGSVRPRSPRLLWQACLSVTARVKVQ